MILNTIVINNNKFGDDINRTITIKNKAFNNKKISNMKEKIFS